MPEPQPNPYVAENNARNLPRVHDTPRVHGHVNGTVLERPEGELKLLWLLYARLLEREVQARRQSDRKQRRKREAHV